MIPLKDSSCLKHYKAKLYKKKDFSWLYAEGKPLEAIKRYSIGNFYKKYLFCTLLSESKFNNNFCFNRRVNQAFLSIEYMYSGSMTVCSNGKSYIAEAYDICLFHPHLTHEFLVNSPQETHKAGIILEGTLLDTLLDTMKLNRINTIYFPDHKRFKSLVARLEIAIKAKASSASHDIITGISFEILQALVTAHEVSESKIPPNIIEIKDYLKGYFDQDISMHKLATTHGMSIQTLNMKFKQYLSTTAYQYLIRQRMINAARYLLEEDLSIKEIANKVGFDNPLSFSTAFRKYYGKSPKKYIRKHSH